MTKTLHNAIHVPQWLMGGIVVVILGLIIFGGVRSIANVATAVVPFMAIIYILMAVIIICI
ncbi:alanine:cation symporter family protein, partial [Salmonella enterica subsp. enterica serovar Kentucky]|nr:alanine:cation symporter family protein [Salmonella enterica subsp. enterica serovar Kentucky]